MLDDLDTDEEQHAKTDAMTDINNDNSESKQLTAQDLINATRMFVYGDFETIIVGIGDDDDPDFITIYNPRGYDEDSESITQKPFPRMAFDKELQLSRSMITAIYFPDPDLLARYFKNITQSKINTTQADIMDIESATVATNKIQ